MTGPLDDRLGGCYSSEPLHPVVIHPLQNPTRGFGRSAHWQALQEVCAAWDYLERAICEFWILRLFRYRRVEEIAVPSLRGAPSPMASSQCRCVSVNPSTSRFLATDDFSASSFRSRNLWVIQSRVFFRGERLQLERLSQPSFLLSSRRPVQCVSSTFASPSNNGDEKQRSSVVSNVLDKASEPIRAFPWAKAGNVLLRRLLDQFWTLGKWLAIPVLAVSVLSELLYTLLQEKVLVIPIGMICGIVFAGIMRETALELSPSIEEGRIPWHLVALGFLLVALKLISPYLPIWGRISVPHFANGGLWQVIALVNDWRKNHAERERVN